MKKGDAASVSVLLLVVLVMAEVHETAAVSCTPSELRPCLAVIVGGQDPSSECCKKLKEQQPCFCEYEKNPAYKQYIDSPNAKKIAGICGVDIPKC